jgi:DNA-binding CsgD family transcriptional regulator
MTSQHTTYNKLRKSAKQYQIEDRRRQVAIMVAQGISEVEIAEKLGVDNTTISKDIKALKLISQQFIYDITKSDFTYYYKQCLDMVKFILRKQSEIVDKENITKQDMCRAKILGDLLNSINTLNGYYNAAPNMHRTPMRMVYDTDMFGVRPGTRTHKLTPEEEERLLKEMEGKEAAAAELKEDPACSSSKSNSGSNYENFDNIDLDKEDSLDEAEKEMIRSGKALIVGRDKRTGELIIDDHPDDFWD